MNDMIKDRYIEFRTEKESSENTLKTIKTTLNQLGKFEEQFRKDICQFTVDDIKQMFEANNDKSLPALKTMLWAATDYTEFCIRYYRKKMDINSNPYLNFTASYFKTMYNTQVLTTESFVSFIDECVDSTELFIALAIYSGMTLLEISLAKYKHIHGNLMDCYDLVDGETCKSRTIYISPKMKDAARQSSNTYKKESVRANGWKDTRLYFGEYIVKDGKEKQMDNFTEYIMVRQKNIYSKVNEMQKKHNISKIFKRVREYGIAQTVFESLARRNAQDICQTELDIVNQKYNLDISLKKLQDIMKNYLEE